MTTINDIYNYIDSIAPFNTQCEWDNSGLLIGNDERNIKNAVLSLDVTSHTVEYAKENNAELIISHHPIIFTPLKNIPHESVVYSCIENHIDVISAHTCFDKSPLGINFNLAKRLGLLNTYMLPDSFMAVGELEQPMDIDAFAEFVKEKLCVKGMRYTKTTKQIRKVALIGGAACEYAEAAMSVADCFITGEVKHHIFTYCSENNFAIIEAGHFETESDSFKMLIPMLSKEFPDINFLWANDNNPVHTI